MEWHPIAAVFPMLDEEDLQDLADDISANGLKQPILTFEGKVLDGRNRKAACRIAQVEPVYEEFTGTAAEALDHCWSLNRQRRHLDSSQKAYATARRLKLSEEYAAAVDRMKSDARTRMESGKKDDHTERVSEGSRSDRETRTKRAREAGTNARYITMADEIEAKRPDLGDKVLKGEVKLPAAYREMRRGESKGDQAPKRPAELRRCTVNVRRIDRLGREIQALRVALQKPEDLEVLRSLGLQVSQAYGRIHHVR